MKYMEYKLSEDGYVNRCLTTGVCQKKVSFRKTVLHGKVNEWLQKGYAVYENPCRTEFYEKRMREMPMYVDFSGLCAGDETEVFGEKKQLQIYFPFESEGVNESGFYEKPMHLRSYGYMLLQTPEEEWAEFEIATCGAVTVWLNGELVTDFVPFRRNEEQRTVIGMSLIKGVNSITVCAEDLAERDTDFYYKMRYKGNQTISVLLPVHEETDVRDVMKAEEALSQMYFEKEAYLSEPVCLQLQEVSKDAVEITVTPDRYVTARTYLILPEQTEVCLFHADEIPSGFYFLKISFAISGISMSRVIGTYSLNTQYMGYHEKQYEERKKRIREIICSSDENSDYRAIILMNEGVIPENLETILTGHLKWVNEKRDCSDFRMVILVYLYSAFGERLSGELKKCLENAMAGYRYWIDEPGDDVMWFFSENHALMFHICQYFAGKAMPDRIFACSGLTGKEVADKADGLLNQWFDSFFKEFVTEWNSSTYIPIDIMGLAYLYDLTPKESVLHQKAKKALDLFAFFLAVNEHKGTIMTSFGRTYERELKGSYSTGMPSLLYLFYNAGYMNEHFRALVPLVSGDYEPPQQYSAYVNLRGSQELIYENTQGAEGYVNLYLYKNAHAVLSTAVGFRPYQAGYQENIVQAAIDGTAQVFLNHPGERERYGNGRPGFWAGNGCLPMAAQYKQISIVRFQIGKEYLIDYTHAYIPLMEFDHYKVGNSAVALEKDGGYIGLRVLNGLTLQTQGPGRNREFISQGRDNIWIVKVGAAGEYQDTDELLTEMEQMCVAIKDRDRAEVIYQKDTFVLDKTTLYVNGKKVHQYPLDVRGKIQIMGGKESECEMFEGI